MAKIYPSVYFRDQIVPLAEANLSVASSSVLYGLSVYTVFPLIVIGKKVSAFCLVEHYKRLVNSARIIGMDTFESQWSYEKFFGAVNELSKANTLNRMVFVRATVHVDALVPGTRSRGLSTVVSMFMYEADPILPREGARLKTSVWRRIPDFSIPSRAKVNGAYVNSVLAKQDALDSGYDDCIFLDVSGHVCELSAANIFVVRGGVLLTPGTSSDILEGINRGLVIQIARERGIPVIERSIDLTELYIADEVFVSGTSAFIASVSQIDARTIGDGTVGLLTKQIQKAFQQIFEEGEEKYFTRVEGKIS